MSEKKARGINSLINLGGLYTEPLSERPLCPYCGRDRVIKKEWIERKVWDMGKEPVAVLTKRYACQGCGKRFIVYSHRSSAMVSPKIDDIFIQDAKPLEFPKIVRMIGEFRLDYKSL